MADKGKGKDSKSRAGCLFVFLLILGIGSLVYFKWAEIKSRYLLSVTVPPAAVQPSPQKVSGKLAIIIDDLGFKTEVIDQLLEMKMPLTYSFLPELKHTRELAEKVHQAGGEILVHMPMEPRNYPKENPGKNAIFVKMSDRDIRRMVKKNIELVPYAVGMNNHMGSRATENPRVMNIVLEEAKVSKLFFVDSLTSPRSVGYKLAKKMGIPTARRDVFLDDKQKVDYTRHWLDRVIRMAVKDRKAIAVGHPYPSTLTVLKEDLPKLRSMGVELVPVSKLIEPAQYADSGH